MTPQQAWAAALGRLQLQMTPAAFDTWLRDSRCLAAEDGTYLISVPNAYAQAWLEGRLAGHIKRVLGEIVQRSVELRFTVSSPSPPPPPTGPLWQLAADGPPPEECGLHPRYSFGEFICGPGNALACSAAQELAARPDSAYNPLFVFGPPGSGKTHLLQAMGHLAREGGARVRYVTAEVFTNELILALRRRRPEEFRQRYRSLDLLLVDDIHFLDGKRHTEQELLHTANALQAPGRRLAAAADQPPAQLRALCGPLRSRLAGGLVAGLQPPDTETRTRLLAAKAQALGLPLPPETLSLLADWPVPSIRELEGALRRVLALARLNQCLPTPAVAQAALKDLRGPSEARPPEALLPSVARAFRLSPTALCSRRRDREAALARQVAMYLLRQDFGLSLQQVGRLLGGRDHTTVAYGCHKIASLLAHDPGLQEAVREIRSGLGT